MGDHFVLMVDRLLTESTLEAAIESNNQRQQAMSSGGKDTETDVSFHKMVDDIESSPSKLAECRICQDEDQQSNMETPCSCCGSLKYAHRKCIQRWCNEKGDTNCEICRQQYKPNYTAPSPLFRYGSIPMNFRGNWEVSRRDLHNPGFIAMVNTDHEFQDSDLDEDPAPSPSSVICCRLVAIIFTALLVLRHTLPVIIKGAGKLSSSVFMFLTMRIVGILLPIYVMVKAFTAVQRRRLQQDLRLIIASSDEDYGNDNEAELPQLQPHSRSIHIQ